MKTEYSPLVPMLEPVVRSLGFALHGVERFKSGKNEILRVYIDGQHGNTVNLDDCAAAHSPLVAALSDHGIHLSLEVSSPGVDRLLFTPAQLATAVGSEVSIRTTEKLAGRRRFSGELLAVDKDGDAVLQVDGERYVIAVSTIERAKLILSENMRI